MTTDASRALQRAYEAYHSSWRRKRRCADVDLWAASVMLDWISGLRPRSVDIIDIGCGAVWLTEALSRYGPITGIDCANLNHPASVRALARGAYDQDPALLPRYLTPGATAVKGGDGFGLALALGAPDLPNDLHDFCRKVGEVLLPGAWLVWNPPTHHAFNTSHDWRACLGAQFSLLNSNMLTGPFEAESNLGSEALILLARRNEAGAQG